MHIRECTVPMQVTNIYVHVCMYHVMGYPELLTCQFLTLLHVSSREEHSKHQKTTLLQEIV